MTFQDLFSAQSKTYAQFRPTYPETLFEYLTSLTASHNEAWDCGTGNGQAALALASHYRHVWATDPSSAQIANAAQHERITYKVGAETQPSVGNSTIDLVTVAQALHWFDFDNFYNEVRRVATPGAIIAAWAYDFNEPIQPDLDKILNTLYFDTLGSYWAPNNKLIWDGYRDIPFPFEQVSNPPFEIEANLNLLEFMGYLASWSSSTKFLEKHGFSALDEVFETSKSYWGDSNQRRLLKWKLHLKVGKINY